MVGADVPTFCTRTEIVGLLFFPSNNTVEINSVLKLKSFKKPSAERLVK